MYNEGNPTLLLTGDIVRLELADFKSFVRHESFLNVLAQFEGDENYTSRLWAVLNQPCDMVHDPTKGRIFKSNLFLCPLQGLRSALKKGALGDIVHYESLKKPENALTEAYRKYFTEKVKRENPQPEGESPKDYNIRLNRDLIHPALERIESELATVSGQFHDPQDVLNALKEYYESDNNLVQSLAEFETTETWGRTVQDYQKSLEIAEKKNKSIILKSDAKNKLPTLYLNQLDSQGIFFYEPHKNISQPEHDLSYVILLQDLLTVKVKKESQNNGTLFELLKQKRVLSLTENFSDRLLNIMGNYFSKIGTGDVRPEKIIELYTDVYAGEFFIGEDQFKKFHSKQT